MPNEELNTPSPEINIYELNDSVCTELRELVAGLGHDPDKLKLPAKVHEMFDLNARIKKREQEAIATFGEVNNTLNIKHRIALETMYKIVRENKLFNPEQISSTADFLDKITKISEEKAKNTGLTKQLAEYSKYSWYITILNQDALNKNIEGIYTELNDYGIEISKEDILETGIQLAYINALKHFDPEKTSFIYILHSSNFKGAVMRKVIQNSEIDLEQDMVQTLSLQKSAKKFLSKTEYANDDKKVMELMAMIYLRNRKHTPKGGCKLEFELTNTLQAFGEFLNLLSNPDAQEESKYLTIKVGSRTGLKREVDLYLDKSRQLASFFDQYSLEDSNKTPPDLIESGRPTEEAVEENLLSKELNENLLKMIEEINIGKDAKEQDRNRQVFKMRHGLTDGTEYTQEEVAEEFELTKRKVRLIESQFMVKMRRLARDKEID